MMSLGPHYLSYKEVASLYQDMKTDIKIRSRYAKIAYTINFTSGSGGRLYVTENHHCQGAWPYASQSNP